jgi:hypothetical protein
MAGLHGLECGFRFRWLHNRREDFDFLLFFLLLFVFFLFLFLELGHLFRRDVKAPAKSGKGNSAKQQRKNHGGGNRPRRPLSALVQFFLFSVG